MQRDVGNAFEPLDGPMRVASGQPYPPRAAWRVDSSDSTTTARRVVIERLQPQIDDGRFPIKRTVGEAVSVTVDMFADGHDAIGGVLLATHPYRTLWQLWADALFLLGIRS